MAPCRGPYCVRTFCLTMLALLAAFTATVSIASAETMYVYKGARLRPHTGNGIQGIKRLHFTLTGRRPSQGECVKNLSIVSISDGAYSLKSLEQQGFIESPPPRISICSDANTGALSEKLVVTMALYSQGNLIAGYIWNSENAGRGKFADSIDAFANIEYHVSETRKPGLLTTYHVK